MSTPDLPADGVLVVGVGYVGRRVLETLSPGKAFGLSRSPVTTTQPVLPFDLDSAELLPLRLPDSYRVLYTVAPAADSQVDVRLERFLRSLNPAPGAFVYISTTGVYGDREGALVDEQCDPRPATPRARRRLAAEQALQNWSDESDARLFVLRTPGIYGPDRLGVERIRDGQAVLCERDANPGNRIHVDDLVTCCIAALSDDRIGGIFNIGDGDFRTSTWFAGEVARQSGLAPPPEISREQAEQEFPAQRMSFLAESRRIDTSKMRTTLGVKPRYANAEDGIRASLQESLP